MAKSRVLLGIALVCLFAAPSLSAQGTADEAVRQVFTGLEQNRAEVLWQALPASYQVDVTSLVHGMAANADPQLWNGSFRIVAKLAKVLEQKKEYIQKQPMVAAKMGETPGAEAGYDVAVKVLRTLAESELSDVARVKTLDVQSFLSGTVSQIVTQIRGLAMLSPESAESLESLGQSKVSLVSQKGNHAVVRIVNGDKSEDKEMTLVEGKWIPSEMAEEWKDKVAEIQAQLAELPSNKGSEESAQFLAIMGPVEGALDQLLAAQTNEQFESAVQQLVGMVMVQFAGAMSDAGQDQDQDQDQ